MIDFDISENFYNFLDTLSASEKIDIDNNDNIKIFNRDTFLELGFGLYLLLLHIHKRPRTPLLYFTRIQSDQTLFLVSPYQDNPYFCRPKGHRPGDLYLESLESCFKTNPSNCQFCDLRNSLLVNISYFKHTSAFKNFLNDEKLNQIRGDFPKIRDCSQCKPRYFSWVDKKLNEDDRYGLCLGGYPALLKISANVFKLLFKEPPAENRLKREISALFDYFLTVYLAARLSSTKYTSNATITSPFTSFEIDSAVLIGKQAKQTLLIIETATYHHDLKKLKNKIINYSALNLKELNGFRYIYITLTQGLKVKINKEERELEETDRDLGALASIMTDKNFECLNLSPEFKNLDTNLVTDWWNKLYLRNSYDYLMDKIEDLTNQLKIE